MNPSVMLSRNISDALGRLAQCRLGRQQFLFRALPGQTDAVGILQRY